MRFSRNLPALFTAGLAAVSLGLIAAIPSAQAADSYPPSDAQTLGSAQPRFSAYRVQDIRDWSPLTDPWAPDLRAEVPLQPRIQAPAATQVNPQLDGKAQVMLMQGDYGNSFFNATPYNNDYTENALNFWQYTDYYSPWHGAATATTPQSLYDPANSDWHNRGFEFGIVSIPNPAYTNAAHRNGVKSIASIYFDPAFRPGLTFREMFDKDPQSQGYIIANKLIEMAQYYGYDGYFLNQEETGDDSEFKSFMAYLTSKGLYTQWYDTNSQFDADKAAWLKDSQHGQIHNSVFVNYGWPDSVESSLQYAAQNDFDPYAEIFFGVEANQNKFSGGNNSALQLPKLYASDSHNPRASIALFTPSDFYQRGLDDDVKVSGYTRPLMQTPAFQWMIHERERMYFSGVNQDVTKTGLQSGFSRPDVGVNDASGWVGVADFTPARSVISGTQFYSTFNTGHGMARWNSGQVTSQQQWDNLNEQSILPSWQWWITRADGTSAQPDLKADFDYGSYEKRVDIHGQAIDAPFTPVGAWEGGSSLAIYGTLNGQDTLRLFRTDLQVTAASRVELVARNVSGNAQLALGIVDKNDPTKVQKVELSPVATDANGWTTYRASLADRAGSTISTLALIASGQGKMQVNLGALTLKTDAPAPAAPTDLTLTHLYTDGQAQVTWTPAAFSAVDRYELSAVNAAGERTALGGTYGSRFYVKQLDLSASATLELVAVGKDGQRSPAATTQISPSTGVSQLQASATDSTKDAQTLDVAFAAAPQANGYQITLTLLNTGCKPGQLEWSKTLSSAELKADASGLIHTTLRVPYLEGRDYDLQVTPLKDAQAIAGAQTMSLRATLPDLWAAPLPASDVSVTAGQMYLRSPSPADWHVITVTSADDRTVFTATRGTGGVGVDAANLHLHEPIDLSAYLNQGQGSFAIRLTDYAGNESQPTVVTVENAQAKAITAPAASSAQSCNAAAEAAPADPTPDAAKPTPEPSTPAEPEPGAPTATPTPDQGAQTATPQPSATVAPSPEDLPAPTTATPTPSTSTSTSTTVAPASASGTKAAATSQETTKQTQKTKPQSLASTGVSSGATLGALASFVCAGAVLGARRRVSGAKRH